MINNETVGQNSTMPIHSGKKTKSVEQAVAESGLADTPFADDFRKGGNHDPARRMLIKGGTVLTMDTAVGDFLSADVLIEGTKIVEIGPNI